MKFLKLGLFAAAASAALIISASAAGNTNLNGGTVTAQSSLNLRAEASTSSELLGSATSGSKLIVVSDTGDGWYEVNYNGKSGYMYSSYIQLGAVESDFGIGCVCGDTVNVRASAGTDSAVVAQFDNGKVLNITGVSGEWYKISDGSVSGYIRSDYISLTLGKGTVNGNNVRMRSEANTESEIITHYNYGQTLDLLALENEWYKVSDGTNTGYIRSDYITCGTSIAPTANTTEGQKLVNTAMKYLGVPYVYGGTSPSCFDCSGLVYYVYRENGYSITRRASTIWYDGTSISKDQLEVGDCVFFSSDSSSSIEHVGIYIGNGQFIHASSGGGCVKINNLSDSYYLRNYYGACRIV